VIIWDEGEFELVREREGHLVVALEGRKLHGGFALTRTDGKHWILVKMDDAAARRGSHVVAEEPGSVRSGRTLG
jgi:bifunctional non-homologous end joining protein LigD